MLNEANYGIRPDDFTETPARAAAMAIFAVRDVLQKMEKLVSGLEDRVNATVDQAVSARIEAAVQRLDHAERPWGTVQKLKAIADRLDSIALAEHKTAAAKMMVSIEEDLPALIDRALVRHEPQIEAFLNKKIAEAIERNRLAETNEEN